ncbi:MAG: hypothetical protein QM762_29120 [Chryseolinea sp.]
MIKYSYVLLGIALLCAACTKNERETPNGFKYVVLASGDGVLPKKDEILIFDFLLKDSKDSVWSNTHAQGIPGARCLSETAVRWLRNLASFKCCVSFLRVIAQKRQWI